MRASACNDLIGLSIANPYSVALHNLGIFGEISRCGERRMTAGASWLETPLRGSSP
jgi:hypothetical protein